MRKIITINNEKILCKPIEDGEGSFAKCFLLPGGKLLKVYRSDLHESAVYHDDDLNPLLGIKNDTFVFPESLFLDEEGVVKAYITRYIPGHSLFNLGAKASLDDIIDSTGKVYRDIEKISSMDMYTNDVSTNNIILNKRINVIDSDNYFILPHTKYKECLSTNYFNFNDSIIDFMTKAIPHRYLLSISSLLSEMKLDMLNEKNPQPILAEYLRELKSIVEYLGDHEVKSVGDAAGVMARLRK